MSNANPPTTQSHEPAVADRREHPRVASGQPARAAVMDGHGLAAKILHELEVENVSAGGMALISATQVQAGHEVMLEAGSHGIAAEDSDRVRMTVLDCTAWRDGKFIIRLQVSEGDVPAQLMFNW